jgi:hypothetical protein
MLSQDDAVLSSRYGQELHRPAGHEEAANVEALAPAEGRSSNETAQNSGRYDSI